MGASSKVIAVRFRGLAGRRPWRARNADGKAFSQTMK